MNVKVGECPNCQRTYVPQTHRRGFLYKLTLKNSSKGVVFIRLCSLAQGPVCSPSRGGATGASAPTALVRGMVHGMRLVGRAQRVHWSGPCCPEESGICPCGRRVAAGQWRSCSRAVGHKRGRYPQTPGRNVPPGPDDAHSEGPKGVSLVVGREVLTAFCWCT